MKHFAIIAALLTFCFLKSTLAFAAVTCPVDPKLLDQYIATSQSGSLVKVRKQDTDQLGSCELLKSGSSLRVSAHKPGDAARLDCQVSIFTRPDLPPTWSIKNIEIKQLDDINVSIKSGATLGGMTPTMVLVPKSETIELIASVEADDFGRLRFENVNLESKTSDCDDLLPFFPDTP